MRTTRERAAPRARPTLEELALRARETAGEQRQRSFGELVVKVQGPLFAFAMLRTRSAADAEELAQEALLRAWRHLDRYDPRWRFSTWLFVIVRNLAASRARSQRPAPLALELAEAAGSGALEGPRASGDPAALAEEQDERENLWRLAACVLPAEQRSALWLRYAEGLSMEEVAHVLGRPRVTTRVLLHRARRTLARHLAPAPGRSRLSFEEAAGRSALGRSRARQGTS